MGYGCLVSGLREYVKKVGMMNVIEVEKGKEGWGMIGEDMWEMILGKGGELGGKVGGEIVEKGEGEGGKLLRGKGEEKYGDELEK